MPGGISKLVADSVMLPTESATIVSRFAVPRTCSHPSMAKRDSQLAGLSSQDDLRRQSGTMDVTVSSVPMLGTVNLQVPNTGTVDDVKWSLASALRAERGVWMSPPTFRLRVGDTHVPFTAPLRDVRTLSFRFKLS